jgi:uncharacterized protein YqgV (UPF0045/DUF77 family)
MVLLEFSMAPLAQGESVEPAVTHCQQMIADSGLD